MVVISPARLAAIRAKRKGPLRTSAQLSADVHNLVKIQNRIARKNFRSGLKWFQSNTPMRPHMVCKHRYCATHTMTVGTSGVLGSIQKYKLNGLYDTDESGVGHQASGFDELCALYHRYKVMHCNVKLEVFDPDGDGVVVAFLLSNPSNYNTSIGSLAYDTVAEKQQGGKMIVSNTGTQYRKTVLKCPISLISGITKSQFRNSIDTFTGSGASDPGNLCKIQFAAADSAGGSSKTVKVRITLEYNVFWYQRKDLAQS